MKRLFGSVYKRAVSFRFETKRFPAVPLYFKLQLFVSLFSAFTRVGDIVTSNSLTEITTKMHNDNDLPISLKASLVYRGLPVINCTK